MVTGCDGGGEERVAADVVTSTANEVTPLSSVPLKLCVDWQGLFMAQSKPLCCFPFTEPGNANTEWTARTTTRNLLNLINSVWD